jgi:putative heme-binding domain-containing protein
MLRRVFLVCWLVVSLSAQEAEDKRNEEKVADKNPHDTPADAARGRQYFLGHCAFCHGPAGEGGRGVNLTTGQYRMGSSDAELFRTIRRGIEGTEMPGNGLSQPELWTVVTYVRSLAAQGAPEKASGDPAAGRVLFDGKGACGQCHWINRRGGVLGPDLSEIGTRRALRFLRESLTDPDKFIADDYRTVSLVTSSGEKIQGIELNQDEYTIQLRDTKANMRSFRKTDLKDVRRETKSLMPAYRTALTDTEIENLVAYMSSLRGKNK